VNGSLIIFLLPIALVVLLINSQRKRTRQAATLQNQLAPGAEVCTTSGLFGTIVSMTDTQVVLEAAPGVHLRFDRRAVGLVVPSEVAAANHDPADPADPADSADSDHSDHSDEATGPHGSAEPHEPDQHDGHPGTP
jgi:preprotein translocase subunit YajC